MVSGAAHTTAHTIRPALEVIKTVPDVSIVSSVFFMCLADRVLVYGDCAVNPDPTAEQLADIAISSAETAAQFGVDPRVAMLSYSTGSSGSGADVEKVRAATELVRSRAPTCRRGADPVRRGRRPGGRRDEAQGTRRSPGRHRADLPRPQHRQQHLQGGAAQRGRGRHRAGPAGAAQPGQRPVPWGAWSATSSTRSPSPRSRQEPSMSRVLVINAGSSSVKYQLLDPDSATRAAGLCRADRRREGASCGIRSGSRCSAGRCRSPTRCRRHSRPWAAAFADLRSGPAGAAALRGRSSRRPRRDPIQRGHGASTTHVLDAWRS
jgi:hypothetical protein